MLTPTTVDKRSLLLGEECALCKNPFAPGDEVIICPDDATRHHDHCWRANGNKCAAYGCMGNGSTTNGTVVIEGAEASVDTSTAVTTPTAEPVPTPRWWRFRRPTAQTGNSAAHSCLLLSIAIAILFFSIGCFGLWAIADYIMLEVLGWQYRAPLTDDRIDEGLTDPSNIFLQGNIEGFQMIEGATYPTQLGNETINVENTFRAFSGCEFHCFIFVEDIKTDKVYELKVPSFISGRPFSNLNWVESSILEFDQSSQPHQAVHYIVDVENQALINAFPYPIP